MNKPKLHWVTCRIIEAVGDQLGAVIIASMLQDRYLPNPTHVSVTGVVPDDLADRVHGEIEEHERQFAPAIAARFREKEKDPNFGKAPTVVSRVTRQASKARPGHTEITAALIVTFARPLDIDNKEKQS